MADIHTMQAGVVLPHEDVRRYAELLVSMSQIASQLGGDLIDRLDIIEGDPDLEDDDPSGQCDEDGVSTNFGAACGGGPGCEISDPGGCEHDGREPEAGF